jgi:hypothetical protein
VETVLSSLGAVFKGFTIIVGGTVIVILGALTVGLVRAFARREPRS